MSTAFQNALHDFVTISVEYHNLLQRSRTTDEENGAAQTLARVGDVLESALRQMIREEARSAVLPRIVLPHGGIWDEA